MCFGHFSFMVLLVTEIEIIRRVSLSGLRENRFCRRGNKKSCACMSRDICFFYFFVKTNEYKIKNIETYI